MEYPRERGAWWAAVYRVAQSQTRLKQLTSSSSSSSRASPSSDAKNIINLVLIFLVMFMHRVFSCVVGRGCLLWSVRSLGKTLLAFALIHFVLQGQIYLLLHVSLGFLLLHSSTLWWKKKIFILVLVLEGPVGLHKTTQFQLLWHSGWGIDLGYYDV